MSLGPVDNQQVFISGSDADNAISQRQGPAPLAGGALGEQVARVVVRNSQLDIVASSQCAGSGMEDAGARGDLDHRNPGSYAAMAAGSERLPSWCFAEEQRVFVSVAPNASVMQSLDALGLEQCVCWARGRAEQRHIFMFRSIAVYADWVSRNPQFLSVAMQRPCDSGRFGTGSLLHGKLHALQLHGVLSTRSQEMQELAQAIAAACHAPVLCVLPRECRVLLYRSESFVEPAAGRVAGVSWGSGNEFLDTPRSVAYALPPPLCRGHSESFAGELRRRLEESPVGQCSVVISWRRIARLSVWFCRVSAAVSSDILLEQLRSTCFLGERVVASYSLQQLFDSVASTAAAATQASVGAQTPTAVSRHIGRPAHSEVRFNAGTASLEESPSKPPESDENIDERGYQLQARERRRLAKLQRTSKKPQPLQPLERRQQQSHVQLSPQQQQQQREPLEEQPRKHRRRRPRNKAGRSSMARSNAEAERATSALQEPVPAAGQLHQSRSPVIASQLQQGVVESPPLQLPIIRKRGPVSSVPREDDGRTSTNVAKHVRNHTHWDSESESEEDMVKDCQPLPTPKVTVLDETPQQQQVTAENEMEGRLPTCPITGKFETTYAHASGTTPDGTQC